MIVAYKRTVLARLPDKEYSDTTRGEGLNIKMFQMQQGGLSSPAISGTGQTKKTG